MRRRPSRARLAATAALVLGVAGLAAGCGETDTAPAAEPHPAAAPPDTAEAGPYPLLRYTAPQETLLVREGAPRGDVRLLFYRGRGVTHDAEGRAYVPDETASRVLAVGGDLRVKRAVGGPSDASGGLGLPLAVAATTEGGVFVVDVEDPKGLVYFDPSGAHVGGAEPPVLNPALAGGEGSTLWAARSPYIYGFEPTPVEAPLLYRFDPLAGEGVGVARLEDAGQPSLNRLANAGAVAADREGSGYFAFLLRNELRAYGTDGDLRWRSTRALPFETPAPTVEPGSEGATFRLRPVTQALSVGPDGLLYALTAADSIGVPEAGAGDDGGQGAMPEDGALRRVEVWDPADGRLLRASSVPASWTTLAADADGRVYAVDPRPILASAPRPERRPVPDVALVGFDGDTARFADYRGKALLVNFWASWCEPCKRELPELKEYYGTLDHDRVEFLAISEDTDAAAARRFAEPMELPFPLFLGHGRMRDRFRYMGLPYTLVVDYRGRIVQDFLGFGSEATWRQLTSTLEAEMERVAAPASDGAGEGHDHGSGPGEAGDGEEPEAHAHGAHDGGAQPTRDGAGPSTAAFGSEATSGTGQPARLFPVQLPTRMGDLVSVAGMNEPKEGR